MHVIECRDVWTKSSQLTATYIFSPATHIHGVVSLSLVLRVSRKSAESGKLHEESTGTSRASGGFSVVEVHAMTKIDLGIR